MREERAFLRHVADTPLTRRQIDFTLRREECFAADLDLAIGDRAQPGDGIQQCCFAGTRRPKYRGDARFESGVDIELEIRQRYAAAELHFTSSFPSAAAIPTTTRTETPARLLCRAGRRLPDPCPVARSYKSPATKSGFRPGYCRPTKWSRRIRRERAKTRAVRRRRCLCRRGEL